MAALKGKAATSPSQAYRHALNKYLVIVVVFCFCFYAFVWRHYVGLIVGPSYNRYDYRNYYQATHENADLDQVEQLLKELTDQLPTWLEDYVEWHAQVRQSMMMQVNHNDDATPILLVSIEMPHSGGLADRLRSLPFLLWEAIRTKRLFLIQWKQPCALQEFLLPPLGGIDWTVPESLDIDSQDTVWYTYDDRLDNIQLLADDKEYQQYSLIKTRHSVWTFEQGMPLLAKELNVTSLMDPIFSRIYKLLFAPSPPVQSLLKKTMSSLDLVPRHYVGVHLRARYPGGNAAFSSKRWPFGRSVDADGFKWTREAQQQVKLVTTRAIACLESQTFSTNHTAAIYFASDTNEAVRFVATTFAPSVVGMVTRTEKLHLDRNSNVPPSSFLPALVDLLLLSQASCLSVGAGGFGVFAAILGGMDCLLLHSNNSFVSGNVHSCGNEEKDV